VIEPLYNLGMEVLLIDAGDHEEEMPEEDEFLQSEVRAELMDQYLSDHREGVLGMDDSDDED
jgi:hypothetical protein